MHIKTSSINIHGSDLAAAAARNAGMIGVQWTGRKGWRRVFPQIAVAGDIMKVPA
ncbi:hypothetical protein V3I01_13525 [Sphingomonas sp. gentR]|uniref:hypothetical protein n=1 Tax=Sphingomonas sp. gentR TaxID=3118768 RepID=UPI0030CF2293